MALKMVKYEENGIDGIGQSVAYYRTRTFDNPNELSSKYRSNIVLNKK